jgi:hypothetical protein
VTARADSTGLENNQAFIVKHHHSVKKMQTPSVARRNARERNRVKVRERKEQSKAMTRKDRTMSRNDYIEKDAKS